MGPVCGPGTDPDTYAKFIPYADAVVPDLLDHLEVALLEEISRVLSGQDADLAVAERVRRSASLANAAMQPFGGKNLSGWE